MRHAVNCSAPLLRTITSVYAAPGSVAGWETALGEVVKLSGGDAGVYLLVDENTLVNQIPVSYGYSAREVDHYEERGAREDIRMKFIPVLDPGKAYREVEYCPDMNEYEISPWIRAQREMHGRFWNIAARISKHGLWTDLISITRLESLGPFGSKKKLALESVLPHLSRAAELHRIVTRLESAHGAVLAALDKLLVGLVILDTTGYIIAANTAARTAVHETGALRITRDSRLSALDDSKDLQLQRLINLAAQSVQNAGSHEGGSLTLQGRHPGHHLLAEVMPIRDDGLPDRDNIRGVAVFLIDPGRAHILNIEGLARIFSLSQAECSVAKALVNGARPREIAEERGTSFETVRSQIKSIFGKTGASSDSDLVRLAAKADPPIERT